ncbi:MAG: hypothetical protein N3B18_01160, partial [Desulfobacterota bacterium]|nr:hypothetical protein [Thermodesulfobacteriota bacterium]
TSFKEAISFLSDCPVCAVFFDAGLPLLDDIPPNIAAIPIVHGVYVQETVRTRSSAVYVLYLPASVFDIMAIMKSIIDPGLERRRDYVYQFMRSKRMLRDLLFLIDRMAEDTALQITLGEGLYEYCVSVCPHAISGDPPAGDGKTYHLLTVSVAHGKRQCALFEECNLHRFSAWLQQEYPDVFKRRPSDTLPRQTDDFRATTLKAFLQNLISQHDTATTQLYEVKKRFCMSCCDQCRNGTDFHHGDVLISEWADIFRNQCLYCPHPACPLNRFFELLVYRLTTV